MREIKFRAWSEDTLEMVQVARLDIKEETIHYENGIKSINREQELGFWWKPYVLMQYTGFKDKNGVEIYEGDIVKVISGYGWEDISDVIFGLTNKRYGSYPAFCMPRVETESNSFSEVFDSGDYEVEVIGNIYQNKDLLGEEE